MTLRNYDIKGQTRSFRSQVFKLDNSIKAFEENWSRCNRS